MTRRLHISSCANDRVKRLRRLQRHGRREGVFLAHGYRQLARAVAAHAPVREVYAAPELFLGDAEPELLARVDAPVVHLARDVFRTVATDARPDGLLAVVERWPTALDIVAPGGLVLVAERIERPGNLGTIVRTASAAGVSALVLADPCTDVFHPDAVHASVGALFEVPVGIASTADAVAWCRGRVVVASPDGARAHWDVDYGGDCVVVVGNERAGVGDAWRRAADETVRIPLPGPPDSLNVAVAAGIVIFEAVRSRSAAPAPA